jgi:integration host factor subunit beta
MTRSDLIEKIAFEKDISKIVAECIVTEVFKSMTDALIAGNRIEIRGFGSFDNRDYDGRTGRNPKSGNEVNVPARKRPFFKVGKALQEQIMGSGL